MTVATAVLLLLQVPPGVAVAKVVLLPWHRLMVATIVSTLVNTAKKAAP